MENIKKPELAKLEITHGTQNMVVGYRIEQDKTKSKVVRGLVLFACVQLVVGIIILFLN